MFLASLASLSLVTITSHHELDSTTNTVAFHHSKPIMRHIPAPSQHRLECRAHGTRVSVHDLFGNMPVRVKHRALSLTSTEDLDREWESLRTLLTGLLLATGKAVKVIVSSSDKSRKLTLRCPPESSGNNDVEYKERQNILDLERVQTILSQTGYINPSNFPSWVTVSARTPAVAIASAISVEPSPTKQVQFISFGIHPTLPQKNANVIYEEINRIFTLSSFGNVEDGFEAVDGEHKPGVQQQGSATPKRKLKGSSKGINRWPMFYIRINTYDKGRQRTLDNDVTIDSDKLLQTVLDVLGTLMHSFLEQHNFRPRARKRVRSSKTDSQPSNSVSGEKGEGDRTRHNPSSTRGLLQRSKTPKATETFLDDRTTLPSFGGTPNNLPNREFGSWSRIKCGSKDSFEDICSGLPRGKDTRSGDRSRKLLREVDRGDENSVNDTKPSSPTSTVRQTRESPAINLGTSTNPCDQTSDEITDQAVPWTDPVTKAVILINARTGQVLPPAAPVPVVNHQAIPLRSSSTGSFRKGRLSVHNVRPNLEVRSGSDSWIEGVLRKWENPVFPQTEKPIPSVSVASSDILPPDQKFCDIKLPPYNKYKGKLTKAGLEQAEVISQVDHKFILAKMVATPEDADEGKRQEQVLVLIDQHAADERCRIEGLFRDLFQCSFERPDEGRSTTKVQTTLLPKPLVSNISAQEVRLFESYMEYFASWGCFYEITTNAQRISSVAVTRLPTLISERCRLEPKLAIDMLRSEIWAQEEEGTRKLLMSSSLKPMLGEISPAESTRESAKVNKDGETSWIEGIAHCPQGIIDMLNSRSCRSAIMFNDILSLEECEQLVTQLSRCAFPFQCAHGRPSMVPIVNICSSGVAEHAVDEKPAVVNRGQSNIFEEEGEEGLLLDFSQAFRNWQEA